MHSWAHFWYFCTLRPGHPCWLCFSFISRRIFSISSSAAQEMCWKLVYPRRLEAPEWFACACRVFNDENFTFSNIKECHHVFFHLLKVVKRIYRKGDLVCVFILSPCWSLLRKIEPSRSKPTTLGSVHSCKFSTHRWSSAKTFQPIVLMTCMTPPMDFQLQGIRLQTRNWAGTAACMHSGLDQEVTGLILFDVHILSPFITSHHPTLRCNQMFFPVLWDELQISSRFIKHQGTPRIPPVQTATLQGAFPLKIDQIQVALVCSIQLGWQSHSVSTDNSEIGDWGGESLV